MKKLLQFKILPLVIKEKIIGEDIFQSVVIYINRIHIIF